MSERRSAISSSQVLRSTAMSLFRRQQRHWHHYCCCSGCQSADLPIQLRWMPFSSVQSQWSSARRARRSGVTDRPCSAREQHYTESAPAGAHPASLGSGTFLQQKAEQPNGGPAHPVMATQTAVRPDSLPSDLGPATCLPSARVCVECLPLQGPALLGAAGRW